ncbi:hypothetical protein EBZ38_06795 [bacterium]|nr:hypothetical protein [bacterium]NDG27765.1 hypothetical protein [Pseudomonadota bacterium]
MGTRFDLVGRPVNTGVNLRDVLKSGYGDKRSIEYLSSKHYELNNTLSDSNQQVYINNESKKILFNVSGTHNLNDVYTDLFLAFGRLKNTKRYREARDRIQKVRDYYKDYEVTVTGHSLGGAIAQYIAKPSEKVYTFNKGATIGQKTRKNEIAYRTKGDIVSILSSGATRSKTLNSVAMEKDPLTNHKTDSLSEEIQV